MATETLAPRTADLVRAIIQEKIGVYGLADIRLAVEPDFEGDPQIRIDVDYAPSGEPVDPSVLARLVLEVRNALRQLGDERFPSLRHHLPDDAKIVGVR